MRSTLSELELRGLPKYQSGAAKPGAGVWLGAAVLLVLAVYDWFGGGVTKQLVLGTASIDVSTTPPGARVLVDTQLLGTTPVSAARVLPGSYQLRIEHPHYLAQREPITVARGDVVQREVTLTPGFGALSLISNPRGATVELNGERLDAVTPITLEPLAAGIYQVALGIYGRARHEAEIEVLPDANAEVSAELNRVPMGSLVVATDPADAVVALEGAPVPYAEGVSLPLGNYGIVVSKPGYGTVTRRLTVRRGPNRLAVDLERHMGELRVSVEPAAAVVTLTSGGRSERYTEPLQLPTGDVRLRATLLGYRNVERRVALTTQGADVALRLPKFDVTVGRVFRDALRNGGEGPLLIVLDAGKFRMGDQVGTGAQDERPVHTVQLRAPFALGVHEVSRSDWALFRSVSEGDTPMTRISREDIDAYLAWLSEQSGYRYRLPSEAEWEYAARGGATSSYPDGETPESLCRYANVADATVRATYSEWNNVDCDDGYLRLSPVGSYAANGFGLYDMLGNASEWVADCWHGSYRGAPADGRVWESSGECESWAERGGAWNSSAGDARFSFRAPASRPNDDRGLRVLREL